MFKQKINECIGLWLAEGDNKTRYEITFTNNCWKLIELFHNTISQLFSKEDFRIRIYVYSNNYKKIKIPIKDIKVNYYIDKRARKPYYIWRLASTDLILRWKIIVKHYSKDRECFASILRGFFAGEGNIKETSHNSRSLRISQAKKIATIDNILKSFQIEYKFDKKHRNGYIIQGRKNIEKAISIGIADLHLDKKQKLNNMVKKYKQYHYKKGYLREKVLQEITFKPKQTQELSKQFNRSFARIQDIVIALKKEGIIENKWIRRKSYWFIKDRNPLKA